MKNYYEILEVNEKASKEIISKVFKMQIKKNHPDLFQGEEKEIAEQKTMLLNEAYEVLSDETKRSEYDKTLNLEKEETINELKNEIYILKEELIKKQNILQKIREEFGLDRIYNNYNKYTEYDDNESGNRSYSDDYSVSRDNIHIKNSFQTQPRGNVSRPTNKSAFSELKTFLAKLGIFIVVIFLALFMLGNILDKDIIGELFKRMF